MFSTELHAWMPLFSTISTIALTIERHALSEFGWRRACFLEFLDPLLPVVGEG